MFPSKLPIISQPQAAPFTNSYVGLFLGDNDYMDGMDNCPTGNFTISAWVYSTYEASSPSEFDAIYSANTQIWFGHNVSSDAMVRLHVGGNSNFGDTAGGTLTKGEWQHVVATWDGSDIKIYIEGDSKSVTESGTPANPSSTTAVIGIHHPSNANQYTGYLDEIAIWDVALDSDAVTTIYNGGTPTDHTINSGNYDNSGDLINYWRFEEGSGVTVADSVGGADGTLRNGASISSNTTP